MPIRDLHLVRRALAPVAACWLQEADGFGIWQDGEAIAYWPESSASAQTPDLRARATNDASDLALGLVRARAPGAQARLDADAGLLARLLQSEAELDLLTEELVARQDQLLAIFELSRLIRLSSDIHATLRTLTVQTRRLLKASEAFVRLEQPDEPALTMMEPAPFADEAFVTPWLERVRDTSQDCVVTVSLDPSRTPHVLVAPVRARGVVAAVLGVTRTHPPFEAPDSKLMLAIVEQASALIENALVQRERIAEAALHTEMNLAARVQRDLMSRTWPTRNGLDLFATTHPSSQVGGDFYDFMSLGDDGLFFCVGDVSGKGVPAALVMAMTRAVLRNAVRTSPPEPQWLLRAAVGSLYEDLTALEMFVTMFHGTYDARTRELRYVNAGHAPVIHRPAHGACTLLTPDEPPLGMLPTTHSRTDHRVTLAPGDLLVIATDGINESRSPEDELFGYQRLMETIDRLATSEAAGIAQAVLGDVERFRGGRPAGDDQTIVVLKGRQP